MTFRKTPLIAVDVDLTLVDTFTPWLHWFQNALKFAGLPPFEVPEGVHAWKVGELLSQYAKRVGLRTSPYEYWRQPRLYHDLPPVEPGISDILVGWQQQGARIAFVSQCEPEHMFSKLYFLGVHFDKVHDYGFVHANSRHKHLVDYDVLIDDSGASISYGMQNRPQAAHIIFNKFNGPEYVPDHGTDGVLALAFNWTEVNQIVGSLLTAAKVEA